jgi:diphthine synthase
MFYIIGLGLSDEKDITLRGLEVKFQNKITSVPVLIYFSYQAVRSSTRLYLEAYTSILTVQKERLVYLISDLPASWTSPSPLKEVFYGKPLILADRDMVETESDEILRDAHIQDVSLLVVGDPFGATTHTDILLRARALGIPTRVIHNASIMNAVGACGLQLYNFGQTVSLVFFTDTWRPDSFYDRVRENADLGMHTLILLDIKVKEQSEENLARCVYIFRVVSVLGMEGLYPGGGRFTSRRGTCPYLRQ